MTKGAWSALPPMSQPRGALAAVAVGTKIYVSGGAKIPAGMNLPDGLTGGGPVELLATLEMFDTETNRWTTLKAMSLPRNHHSVAYADGKIYAVGGRVGSCFSNGWSSNVSMNEAYDIATNTWITRLPMPTARSGTGAEAMDGKVHVLGGEGWVEEFGGVFRAHEVYDPKTNSWAKLPRMLTPRHGFATAQIGRRIFAVSGVNNAGGAGTLSVVAVNEVFEP
jgi:N-acetylneuraminic acid mutarotase